MKTCSLDGFICIVMLGGYVDVWMGVDIKRTNYVSYIDVKSFEDNLYSWLLTSIHANIMLI